MYPNRYSAPPTFLMSQKKGDTINYAILSSIFGKRFSFMNLSSVDKFALQNSCFIFNYDKGQPKKKTINKSMTFTKRIKIVG